MIRINLMPKAEAQAHAARQRDGQVTMLILGLLTVAILAAEVVTRRSASVVQNDADERKTELAELNRKHNDAITLDKKRKELEAKLTTIAVLEKQRTGPVHVLDELSAATPDKLWLTEMNEAGGTMTLSGRALDNQTIANFMRNLQGSRYFGNVDLVETKQIEEKDKSVKLTQFAIKAGVLYAGRNAAKKPGGSGEAPAAGDTQKQGAATQSAPDAGAKPARPAATGGASDAREAAGPASNPAREVGGPLAGTLAAKRAAENAAQVAGDRNRALGSEAEEAARP